MLPVLSPHQSADWDRRADATGIALATLMDAAGRAAALLIAERFPERLRGGVLVATGPGHNGGDGWVLARALHAVGVPVFVAPVPGEPAPLTAIMARLAREAGVRVVEPDGPWPAVQLLVDALLGTGAKGALRGSVLALVERLNDLALPVAAVDGPTGVDLATGTTMGSSLRADLSVTFGGLRRGHLLAREECGDVVVLDIGHPPADPAWPMLLSDAHAAQAIGRFSADAHKGDRGRVVVIGGEPGMSGALRLAARAAFGAGAGLVWAVAPAETVAILRGAEPDLQTVAHDFTPTLSPELVTLLERADAVVVGPGLGRGAGRREFVEAVARRTRRLLLDADALNAFQGADAALAALASGRVLALTPHVGEFARLFPAHAAGMDMDPWQAATAAAAQSGALVVLKGVPTVIAAPGEPPLTVSAGNPGLATGGSGDVLSGIAGTFLSTTDRPLVALAAAGQALGRAAEQAARRTTARGMRPMDVVAALPDLWRYWETLRVAPTPPRPPVRLELPRPQQW